ncbi:hypothetical protein EW145_g6872 [Phellinidium pouzarii]|uniref:Oxidation resistance protein 1 n=1 Tax=Phellinidium pouzarii TaxID=167371 RepID=A0A4S4KSQ0_9AGAM|nr:hypothetical protein EW145_g6872 [Phellinidium pouzarii]
METDTQEPSCKPSATEDHFAVLTMPSSLSPSHRPVFQASASNPKSPTQIARPRPSLDKDALSTASSELGSFVSVSTAEDPLLSNDSAITDISTDAGKSSFVEAQSLENFEKFAEDAKTRTERNERRVLDELRAHEKDPLAWLGAAGKDPSSKSDYSGINGTDDTDNSIATALSEAKSTFLDLWTHKLKVASPANNPDANTPTSPQSTSRTNIHRARSRSPPAFSASLPSSISATLTRGWMPTLLSSPRAAPATPTASSSSPSLSTFSSYFHEAPSENHDENVTTGLSPTQSTLHALFTRAHAQPSMSPSSSPQSSRHRHFATEGHAPEHATTLPVSLPSRESLAETWPSTRPSPFAAHKYFAPSGAPAFEGDHNWNTAGFEFEAGNNGAGAEKGVTLLGRKELTTPVLDGALANAARVHLPALARLSHSWTLLYSTEQHGLSLNTLYARCTPPIATSRAGTFLSSEIAGAFVALQDSDGSIFGVWVGEGVHLSHGSYYGGGDSFLWRLDPYEPHGLQVYKWTGRNDYVALCDTDGFSFGGGEGHYGLYINSSLIEGTTHPCPTFDNECLAQGTRRGRMVTFECVGLEVWGIGP